MKGPEKLGKRITLKSIILDEVTMSCLYAAQFALKLQKNIKKFSGFDKQLLFDTSKNNRHLNFFEAIA